MDLLMGAVWFWINAIRCNGYPYRDRVPHHFVHGPTQCTPKSKNTKISTLLYTIKMDPINAALAALELQDSPNYTWTAKEFNVNRTTLSRRHRRITRTREDATENMRIC